MKGSRFCGLNICRAKPYLKLVWSGGKVDGDIPIAEMLRRRWFKDSINVVEFDLGLCKDLYDFRWGVDTSIVNETKW